MAPARRSSGVLAIPQFPQAPRTTLHSPGSGRLRSPHSIHSSGIPPASGHQSISPPQRNYTKSSRAKQGCAKNLQPRTAVFRARTPLDSVRSSHSPRPAPSGRTAGPPGSRTPQQQAGCGPPRLHTSTARLEPQPPHLQGPASLSPTLHDSPQLSR